MKLKRVLIGLVAVVGLTGCTPEEISDWLQWNATDPTSAQAYLSQPEVATQMASVDLASATAEAIRLNPPPPPPPPAPVSNNSVWDRLAQCESGGNWSINTGNGYYGGLQFSITSWRAVGGTGYPHQNSREEQINRGERLKNIQGWGAWPACSRKLGLR